VCVCVCVCVCVFVCVCVCQVSCRSGWMRLECVEKEIDCVGKQMLQTSKDVAEMRRNEMR
jgi:hypothetical protein